MRRAIQISIHTIRFYQMQWNWNGIHAPITGNIIGPILLFSVNEIPVQRRTMNRNFPIFSLFLLPFVLWCFCSFMLWLDQMYACVPLGSCINGRSPPPLPRPCHAMQHTNEHFNKFAGPINESWHLGQRCRTCLSDGANVSYIRYLMSWFTYRRFAYGHYFCENAATLPTIYLPFGEGRGSWTAYAAHVACVCVGVCS